MTDQFERKKATRRGNRAVITKHSNEAKELLANGEKKLQVVKKFVEEILQLCEVKEIENEIEVFEELNSRVLDVKRQISRLFCDDTGKVPIHDISIPGQNTPQVEITDVDEISSESNVNDETINEQNNVNPTQNPTPSNPTLIHPDPSSPAPSSQSSRNYVIGYASCEHVKDVADRKGILRDQKCCHLCLEGGHCAHKCENGRLCRWCNGKHHQSICIKATKTLRKINPEESTNQKRKKRKNKR
ncbi:Hypothetical predicted protein [Paramuricea clavata]|uniref:Uncharacterized protein n=1 Tax=Paramuricea clavata TaxID=317549 RepID=A0A7D9L9D8_PARCT|nr:Hypothetical predicted protein [Paramuricea clavata]